ncbi:MAG: glycosyltransferase [Acidobacteriia bacterium]|nr:glycosyltransferase [Terriglobia bacterium]
MKIVIFGLSVSSSWGNGHAMLLRGLFRALHELGHEVHFFERDAPHYARWRDAPALPYAHLHLYRDWESALPEMKTALADAEAGMVTSYCADGIAACNLVLGSKLPRTAFYDMDTGVTLSRLERHEPIPYLPPQGLSGFDLVLSYTGGRALDLLHELLGARCVATLYGWVDPAIHYRVEPSHWYEADLSYLGTYSIDRQAAVEALFLTPARRLSNRQFVIGGPMYPDTETWPKNVRHYHHVGPPEHCAFYSSCPLTLNVTRADMAALGYCPSGRFFEAAAVGTAVLSDWWEGLDTFFQPGEEILLASSAADAIAAVQTDRSALAEIARRARERTLDCHTAEIRARRLVSLFENPVDEASVAAPCALGEA